MKTPAALDVRETRRLGGHETIAQAQFLAQTDGVRLLRQQRIGTGVDGEAVHLFAEDDTTGARCALEDREPDAAPMQLVANRKAGDATTDHDDVNSTHVARDLRAPR